MCNRRFEETRSIDIPEDVAEELQERLSGTRFESIDVYASVALRFLLYELEQRDEEEASELAAEIADRDVSKTDVDDGGEVRDRLESLGYL